MRYNSTPPVMPGTLYVVATPIGNLEDITLRALRVLREVALIAAEDTRRTARLLQHYSISTPATSLHEHNERARTPGLIARLAAGESLALVSDAGTPLVSDPGRNLVAAAHAAGIRVEPVPGPSAALAALSASGLPGDGFVFAGFPPAKGRARREWFEALAAETRPVILYEAPHRIHRTLVDIARILGERQILVARELTKAHEELAVRPSSAWVSDLPREQGEFTVIISPRLASSLSTESGVEDATLATEFGRMTADAGAHRRSALKAVARRYGVSARRVFAAVEKQKLSGK